MKPLLILLILSSSYSLQAQGTIAFSNLAVGQGVNAPAYESDGVTKLSGSQFMAQLLAGPTIDNLVSIATTGFLTGNGTGYFNGGAVSVPGMVDGSLAWVQVGIWNTATGATFTQAKNSMMANSWWESSSFSVILGGGTVNPRVPAPLTGLDNTPIYLNSVPEPATTALLGLGVAVLFLRYRRFK